MGINMKIHTPKIKRKSPLSGNFSRDLSRKEGRTTHAAFEAWRNLKFDPAKDEVEKL